MEGPKKPEEKVVRLADYARLKRESIKQEEPVPDSSDKPMHLRLLETWLLPAESEIKRRFPGLDIDIILEVYQNGLLISQDDSVFTLRRNEITATNSSDEKIASEILKAKQQGMTPQTAPRYVAYVEALMEKIDLPPITL